MESTSSENLTFQYNNTIKTNSTYRLSQYPVWYWTARGCISLVTALGNGLVIYLVVSRRQLRHQASPSWLILSLAVADFCVGIFNLPTSLFCRYWMSCSFVVYLLINGFMDIFMIASVTSLCLLTLDRYLAVVHPFVYIALTSVKSRVWLLILVAWLVSVMKGIPYFVFRLLHYKQALFYDSIIYMVLFTIIPNILTLFAYTRIIVVIKRHRTKIDEQEMQVASNNKGHGDKTRRRRGSHNAAVAAVGILNLIFLFCNGFFQYYLTCKLVKGCVVSRELRYATFLFRYFNSAPNFFVYALARKTFRQEIRSMFSTGRMDSAQISQRDER